MFQGLAQDIRFLLVSDLELDILDCFGFPFNGVKLGVFNTYIYERNLLSSIFGLTIHE